MILKITRWLVHKQKPAQGYIESATYIDDIQRITWKTATYAEMKGNPLVEHWFTDRKDDRIRYGTVKPDELDLTKFKVIVIDAYDSKGKFHMYITDTSGWLLNDEGKTLEHIYIK